MPPPDPAAPQPESAEAFAWRLDDMNDLLDEVAAIVERDAAVEAAALERAAEAIQEVNSYVNYYNADEWLVERAAAIRAAARGARGAAE